MIRAKKKFGQNFLIDQHIIKQIIDSINPNKEQSILEIGPGLGALTMPLLNKLHHINVVEIDADMVEFLKKNISPSKINIYQEDILEFEEQGLSEFDFIIGNLPYYISTPILLKIAKSKKIMLVFSLCFKKKLLKELQQFLQRKCTVDYPQCCNIFIT